MLPLLFLSALFLGCPNPTTLSGDPATPYHKVEAAHTREARFFGLEKVRYLTSVVHKSPRLREAYVEEYARRYALPAGEREKLLATERAEAERFDVFLLSHFATDRDVSKLTLAPKAWKISLVADGNEKAPRDPESVTAVAADDAVLRYFYPQVTPWSKVFLVKFKREGDPSVLTLRMTGVAGDLSFEWRRN
jgi:hypothetical protein